MLASKARTGGGRLKTEPPAVELEERWISESTRVHSHCEHSPLYLNLSFPSLVPSLSLQRSLCLNRSRSVVLSCNCLEVPEEHMTLSMCGLYLTPMKSPPGDEIQTLPFLKTSPSRF